MGGGREKKKKAIVAMLSPRRTRTGRGDWSRHKGQLSHPAPGSTTATAGGSGDHRDALQLVSLGWGKIHHRRGYPRPRVPHLGKDARHNPALRSELTHIPSPPPPARWFKIHIVAKQQETPEAKIPRTGTQGHRGHARARSGFPPQNIAPPMLTVTLPRGWAGPPAP